jgi:hypothetical protein
MHREKEIAQPFDAVNTHPVDRDATAPLYTIAIDGRIPEAGGIAAHFGGYIATIDDRR